jgi:glycosyltransferase involved in cell wall biosynthesis
MRALMVCGPFRGPTGYDHHVREFVRELVCQGVCVSLNDVPYWSPRKLPPVLCDPWFETLNKPTDATTVLHFCMPHHVRPYSGLWNVNYTMFEATPAPTSWVAKSRERDLLIVPTESSRAAWIAGGMPAGRIRLCPLGVNPRLFHRGAEPLPLQLPNGVPVASYRTRFLNVSELSPRKNITGLLRAWMKATHRGDDAILILKLGCHDEPQLNGFHSELEGLRLESGKTLAEAAPVHLLHDLYPDAEMPRLFGAATHYFSMSFGEGWDQPAMEAAACGLRLIVPNHSAYPTYLDASIASLISSREIPVHWTGDPATGEVFRNASWWQPDEDEATAHIRAAIEGRDAGLPTAQSRILESFTWEKAVGRLREILSEFDAPKKQRWTFSDAPPAREARLTSAASDRLLDEEMPLVSVILTTRDRPRLLSLALDYYRYQTYARRELIVVDDGELFPVERTAIQALDGRLIRLEPGTPLGIKLNAGVEQAKGTFCQKMDDDDWYAPDFMEKMTGAVLATHQEVCRPTIAFLMPFLFFNVAKWEIRQSHPHNAPGATLLFSRDAWELRQFRPLFQDEDVWFYLDQARWGAAVMTVRALESFLAVRHRGSTLDRGHIWTHQRDGRTLEDELQERPLHTRGPEELLPDFALKVYRELQQELLIAAK